MDSAMMGGLIGGYLWGRGRQGILLNLFLVYIMVNVAVEFPDARSLALIVIAVCGTPLILRLIRFFWR